MDTLRNIYSKLGLMALIAALVAGCATVELRPAALEDARLAVEAARANPQVVSLAPVELSEADAAYQRAWTLYRSEGDTVEVRHLAYLARQRASIAQETAVLKGAELAIANANSERDRVRLLARTREVENAARAAAVAQARADASQRDALVAQQQAQVAQEQARQSQSIALASQQQARDAEILNAALAAELRDIKARPTDRGMVITLGDVLFDTGSARLRSGALRVIDRLAIFLREHPDRTLAIEGFTDSVGNAVVNDELSRRRAESVRAALVDAGIDASRVVARGYGDSYPVASNDTAEGRQRNRRVEIVISDEHGTIVPRVAGNMVPAR
jgi:outer membrane protein OmpA-like peptidoglycan-associated protein